MLDRVRWADVVVESFSVRAMAHWELGYDALLEVKPDLVIVSSSLFGQHGPLARLPGLGTMGAARAGWSA